MVPSRSVSGPCLASAYQGDSYGEDGIGGWRERDRRQRDGGIVGRAGLDGPRPRPSSVPPAGRTAGRRGSAGRARHGRGAARHRPRRRLHHDMVAAGQRGGEHPRQRGHGAQPSRRPRQADGPAPCRAGHRPETLSRAVRGLWAGHAAANAVPRGAGTARRRKFLLRAGGRGVRRRRARRLHLERPSPAYRDRSRRRQCHEHGHDARGLCDAVPRDGAAVHVSRIGGAMVGPDRHDRCAAARPPPHLGGGNRRSARRSVQRRQRRRLSLAVDVAPHR